MRQLAHERLFRSAPPGAPLLGHLDERGNAIGSHVTQLEKVASRLLTRGHAIPHADLRVKLDASFDGPINDLNIDRLLVQLLDKTSLDVRGKIKGLPDIKNSVLNVELKT